MLAGELLTDVDVIKIDFPMQLKEDTPWEITRQSRNSHYVPVKTNRNNWDEVGSIDYLVTDDYPMYAPGTDGHTVLVKKMTD